MPIPRNHSHSPTHRPVSWEVEFCGELILLIAHALERRARVKDQAARLLIDGAVAGHDALRKGALGTRSRTC